MFRRLAVGSLVAISLAASARLAAIPQEPVFRGGVTFVNVDAYPRRDGHLVEGLRAEDFQVLEDGKPQKVTAFEFIRVAPNTPDAERRDPNTKEEGDRLAADPHNRVFVVYLDLYHVGFVGGHDTRGPLLQFLNRTIGPNDLFGVATPDEPKPVRNLVLGRRTETLDTELAKYFSSVESTSPVRTPFEQQAFSYCLPEVADPIIALDREDRQMTSLEDLMAYLRELRDERKNVLFISEGFKAGPPATQLLNLTSGDIPKIGTTPGSGRLGIGAPQVGTNNRSWCDQQIVRLAGIDFAQRFRDLVQLAIRANVSFYPVDVGGLRTGMPNVSAPESTRRPGETDAQSQARQLGQRMIQLNQAQAIQDPLRVLADNTDGHAVVDTNDLSAGFRRIADDLSAYYLLGYSSTNTAIDGKFRRIDVKVNQPKISVTARRGYFGPSADTRAASAAKAAAVAVPATVADELARLTRLRTDTEFLTYGVRSPGGLDVVVEISSAEMARGRWNNGADVRVVLNGSGGPSIAATGRIDPGARGAVVRVPVAPSDAGPWPVNVRVSQGAASLEDRAEISAPEPSAIVGTPIVFRGTSSARIPLRPVADFLFRRNERLRVEWPALQPLSERTARVLDRKGQPLALEATVTEGAPTSPAANDTGRVVTVDLPLAALAEGDYLIELTAGATGKTERRLLAFRVVR